MTGTKRASLMLTKAEFTFEKSLVLRNNVVLSGEHEILPISLGLFEANLMLKVIV